MTLHIIGIGLNDEKDITLKGLEIVKRSSKVYLENYTATLRCTKDALEKTYGKNIILADRELVEKDSDSILDNAKKEDVSLLVVGDPMSATTHIDFVIRAREKGVHIDIVHNASIMTAVGTVGLEMYKYGKTTSIVFPDEKWTVESHYDAIKENKERGLHTLCLLDIKVNEPSKENIKKGSDMFEKPRFMTVNQAIENLLDIESRRKEKIFTEDTICIGCARLGSNDSTIIAGKAKELLEADFGEPMHCLIVPGKLHFMEEEALKIWQVARKSI